MRGNMIMWCRSGKPFSLGCRGVLAAAIFLIVGLRPAPVGGEAVTYRLKWLFNVSVVGGLYADTHGFFEEEGLSVTIKQGGPERDAIRELEMGNAQFGTASADQVIRAREKGAPVVVVAQLFQVNPLQWIYRPDEVQLARPADLAGKTIGITYGGNDETIMRTLLAKAGIAESEAAFFSVRYDYTPFYRRKVNIWPVYRNAQGVILAHKLSGAGEKTAFFNPADHGIRFVANSIVVSNQTAARHPQRVRRFVRALMKGWGTALDPENARRALSTLRRYDKDTEDEVLAKQLDVTRRLVVPEDGAPIGRIDTAAWQQTERIMLDQHQIGQPVDIAKALKPVR